LEEDVEHFIGTKLIGRYIRPFHVSTTIDLDPGLVVVAHVETRMTYSR
jgi:hypothetical protein